MERLNTTGVKSEPELPNRRAVADESQVSASDLPEVRRWVNDELAVHGLRLHGDRIIQTHADGPDGPDVPLNRPHAVAWCVDTNVLARQLGLVVRTL